MEIAETVELDRVGGTDAATALHAAIEQHGHKVFRLAYRMTGNEQDAEDVVQETFLRALRKLGSYDSRAQLSSWLYKIASNYAVDLLRRRRRWRNTGLDDAAPLAGSEPGPDRGAWSAEVRRAVENELGRLSPRERVAFTLRHYEGLSIREIGRLMGLRENAAKNHIFRAVRKMRAALEPLMEQER